MIIFSCPIALYQQTVLRCTIQKPVESLFIAINSDFTTGFQGGEFGRFLEELNSIEGIDAREVSAQEVARCVNVYDYETHIEVRRDDNSVNISGEIINLSNPDANPMYFDVPPALPGRCDIWYRTAYRVVEELGINAEYAPIKFSLLPMPCAMWDLVQTAGEAIREGNPREAIQLADELSVSFPDRAEAWYLRGRAYYMLQEYEQAIAQFEEAQAREGDVEAYDYEIGTAYLRLKNFANAAFYLERQRDNSPAFGILLYEALAVVYREQGNYEQAREVLDDFERIFTNSTDDEDLKSLFKDIKGFYLGSIAFAEENWEETLRLLDPLIENEMFDRYRKELLFYVAYANQELGGSETCDYWEQYEQEPAVGTFGEDEREEAAISSISRSSCS